MACVLIVDDEKNIRSGLALAFEDEGYDTLEAENGEVAWNIINKKSVDLVITDLRMPVMSGYELLKRAASTFPTLPIIVLTGHGSIEDAVKAMQDGAIDFFTKPVDLDHIMLTAKKALNNSKIIEQNIKLTQEITTLKQKAKLSKTIIGKSEKLTKMMSTIEQVAPTKATVLITGESGVGKELVADALHSLSDRKDGPFIKVHCASLSANLLESELFGHEKGSFTGAVSQKKGRFELANGGTIFLDEIGEIDANTQVKILRVLQEREFERVGGTQTIHTDVRVVAATNRNLEEEVKKGNFREDLYYRLNVVHIEVPPLRERKEDIPLLLNSFLNEFNSENSKNIEGFTPQARKLLCSYSWPGNIRQLRNSIESAVVLSRGKLIDVEDLPEQVVNHENESELSIKVGLSLDEAERLFIMSTLDYCGGNKTKASEMLKIGRKTLHRKLEEYGKADD
ncbi:sigma-54 dependent transcriptional regulator [Bullifex porci]|uniref:sigma-54-dependent transcriptional regulator n=1 Tax=Bullifex porci TaxID=2606638 RepID=UPI0023F1026C|nr:sigma-54 dependent transcriptional regulator [Bullifex porci]MDD7255644.1 sigma-54 dependent transcriptional regulator [Bullifex porci]MDY2741054.1 sigma-54 dependent transcriptional regulator [Bullifex porci]